MLLAPSTPADTPNEYAIAAARIATLRDDLTVAINATGYTSKTVSAQIGVTTTTLTKLLNGTTLNPTQATILACLTWLADRPA